jgi:UDP-2,4-diacetamido-2,4,6-trideoxy-beta-L-altropyranose hydrolase
MVIDDLADRPHDCDLLLNQNLGRRDCDYSGLLGRDVVTLIGPQFALLRREFASLRADSLARRRQVPSVKQLLVSLGGVDASNITGQVLDALKCSALHPEVRITVVMGFGNRWLESVCAQASEMPYRTSVLVGVKDMAPLMMNSDLAIGAAGGTAWERCCMGLPSLISVAADNQWASAAALQEAGAAVVLKSPFQIKEFFSALDTAEHPSEILTSLSFAASAVTDGQGCTRVVERMMEVTYG